jgi:hypothetical protein
MRTFHRLSALATSVRMTSLKSLEEPYGLVAPVGKLSVTGTEAGSPYTVADDEKTMLRQPASSIHCTRLSVPSMLTW